MTTRFDAGRLAGTVMAMTLLASAPAIAGFDEAAAAFAVGDYDKALEEIRPLADQGDPRGQYAMGVLYENGFAVARE